MAIFNVANCKITGGYRSLGLFRSLLEHTLLFFGSLLPSSRSQTPQRGDRGDPLQLAHRGKCPVMNTKEKLKHHSHRPQ